MEGFSSDFFSCFSIPTDSTIFASAPGGLFCKECKLFERERRGGRERRRGVRREEGEKERRREGREGREEGGSGVRSTFGYNSLYCSTVSKSLSNNTEAALVTKTSYIILLLKLI